MAPKEPRAWTEIPGLRERRYGAFRLDFGVYVPEMNRGGVPRGPWINDYNCQLRVTIGRLLTGEHGDFWWSLGEPEASAKAGEALRGVGFAWLDRFASAQDILDEFDRVGSIGDRCIPGWSARYRRPMPGPRRQRARASSP